MWKKHYSFIWEKYYLINKSVSDHSLIPCEKSTM